MDTLTELDSKDAIVAIPKVTYDHPMPSKNIITDAMIGPSDSKALKIFAIVAIVTMSIILISTIISSV